MALGHREADQVDMNHPFTDPLAGCGFTNFAVLKIGEIPYACTKAEIAHFLGREAQDDMIDEGSFGPALHIIMERSTSKTMDCFIEFKSYKSVLDQYRRHWDLMTESNKLPRIGHRTVTVEVASQDQLMENLFPRAKCVRWHEGKPCILENEDAYSTGFTGYFTNEEMVGLVRHAEHPQRSPFSLKCPQRTYECMISTLWKFPWAATATYTLGDRNSLFVTYMKLLDVLVWKVERGGIVSLNQKLLLEYIFAGLNCRGFGERQRGLIYLRGGKVAAPIQVLGVHSYWPFDVVSKQPRAQDEEYCKAYFCLLEQGVKVLGLRDLLPAFFDHAEGRLPGGLPPPVHITHFEFNSRAQSLTFDASIRIELELMSRLLTAGYGTAPTAEKLPPAWDRTVQESPTVNRGTGEIESLCQQTSALNWENDTRSQQEDRESMRGLGPHEPERSINLYNTPISKPTTGDFSGRAHRYSEPRVGMRSPVMFERTVHSSEPRPNTDQGRGLLEADFDLSPPHSSSFGGGNVGSIGSGAVGAVGSSGSGSGRKKSILQIKDPKASTDRSSLLATPSRRPRKASLPVAETINEEENENRSENENENGDNGGVRKLKW